MKFVEMKIAEYERKFKTKELEVEVLQNQLTAMHETDKIRKDDLMDARKESASKSVQITELNKTIEKYE